MKTKIINFLINLFLDTTQKGYKGTPLTFSKEGFADWDELNVASGSIYFPEREPIGYTVRNQNGSGSCVAQTIAKMLEVWDFIHDKIITVYSATPIYSNRSNKPQPGMIGTEALDFSIQKGVYLESDIPSQNMGDSQMDTAVIDYTKKQIMKPNRKVLLPLDFYKVAQEVKNNNCVMIWIKCGLGEWQRDIPFGLSNSEAVRHSITVVDCISYKGIEYLIIEDSWGKWQKTSDIPLKDGQRAITKEFFDKHCYFAGAYTEFKYTEDAGFKHKFETILEFGDRGVEVMFLQKALRSEGLFPAYIGGKPFDIDKQGGYYGDTTRRAVFDFQVRHKVASMTELQIVRGKRVGSKTIAKLNELYNT